MLQSDDPDRGAPKCLDATQNTGLSHANAWPEPRLSTANVAEFVLGAPQGTVLTLGGIDGESLRLILDQVEPEWCSQRALVLRITPAATAEAIVEHVIGLLSDTVHRLWPVWFTDVSFSECCNDTLGRLAASVIACRAAEKTAGLSASWATSAARLALDNRPPRLSGMLAATELAQLALAVSRFGLVIVADVDAACAGLGAGAVVHALEWIAQHSHGAVVALFSRLPPNEPPFDRILYGARFMIAEANATPGAVASVTTASNDHEPWIAPWRGLPHPLSETEQRLAKALGADPELAPLFSFNQFVDTLRGSRPKVDLLWMEGRLVVELDGYGVHGNRAAFMYDRHRDYELTLSGYTVLRLADDEIAQDIEKAVEKIRDLVSLRRKRAASEG
jgi:hypothetical protein